MPTRPSATARERLTGTGRVTLTRTGGGVGPDRGAYALSPPRT